MDPRGAFKVTAGGKDYTLWMGMSVLADVQAKHGNDALSKLDPPADAPSGWMPPLQIIVDLFLGGLQRYHADEADRFLVDEILTENPDGFTGFMAAAFPDASKAKAGNAPRPKRAA